MTKEMSIQCPNCGSQIVYETTLNHIEKILTHIFPVTPYRCQPCNYRFVYYSSPRPKTKKRLLITFLTVFVAVIMILISMFLFQSKPYHSFAENNLNQSPVIREKVDSPQTNKKLISEKITNAGNIVNNGQVKSKSDDLKRDSTIEKVISAEIVLQEKPMFGVNWELHSLGLKIIRISSGPLQHAGIQIGDIIHSVNDSVITHEDQLLQIRDQIFSNQILSAILCIYQNNEKKYFRLKNKIQSDQS